MLYEDAFLRLKRVFRFDNWRPEDTNVAKEALELQNGYKIEATYRPTTWMEVRVYKGDEGVLSFLARDSGLESMGSRNPVLTGAREVKLQPLGIGLVEERKHALRYSIDESDNMDILGVQLIEWIEDSVKAGKLQPLDLSIKFPLLPNK